ncbi:MAG TPA: hypothetical protein VM347_39945 [Nonomuraea sp.]|nr:hypothetical protein [Nonomuraea sp.]
MAAASGGDLGALADLLHEDVVSWNDGGGKVRAALRPIIGREKVAAFVGGLRSRYGFGEAKLVEVNGHLAVLSSVAGTEQLVAIEIRDGRIHGLYALLNPDKLSRVRTA